MKTCTRCGIDKELTDFHKDKFNPDGHTSKCKQCRKEVDAGYQRTPEGRAVRLAYTRSVHGKEARAKYKDGNKLKIQARDAVSNALKFNRISKQPCQVCSALKVEAHHPDYNKPLSVTWLCHEHHVEVHINERKKGNECRH